MTCTCDFRPDPLGTDGISVVEAPCPSCALNIWAAELEAKFDALDNQTSNHVSERDVEEAIEEALTDYAKTDDVERDIEDAIEELDLSIYVEKDELGDEIAEALTDTVVNETASKAAQAAVKTVFERADGYASRAQLDALETRILARVEARLNADAPIPLPAAPLSFAARLRVLFTGKL